MAIITISENRKESYVFFDKNGTINISTDKMDEVMVIKAKRGKLYVKSEKKTPADRQLESRCLSNNEHRRKMRCKKNGID